MKREELDDYYYYEDTVMTPANRLHRVYHADEVDHLLDENDAEIASLKADNERLKKCEIWMKQHFFCEEVIACESAKNRRLRRALWLARAERARAEAEYWYGHMSGMYYIDATDVPDEEDNPYRRVKHTTIGWYKIWENVERKCLKKAEEYK